MHLSCYITMTLQTESTDREVQHGDHTTVYASSCDGGLYTS